MKITTYLAGTLIVLILLINPSAAAAQEAGSEAALEEIIVTATKRAESLQDVPIAIAVIDGQRIDDLNINTLDELTSLIPTVMMSEAQAATNIYIRGIGSGQNYGFEQSVGLFVDGIYYSRGRQFRNPFFDVERVEVLKGPQGVLLGKNVVAGAFNITTRKPTEDWENSVKAYWEPEYNGYEFSGILSGPLSDTVGMRLSGFYNQTDGYIENTLAGAPDMPEREESMLRATFQFEPSDTFSAVLKGEVGNYDTTGGVPGKATTLSPNHLALTQAVDPLAETSFDWVASMPATDDPLFTGTFNDTNTETIGLTMNWDLNNAVLTSVSSYVGFDWEAKTNNDWTNLNVVAGPQRQDYSSYSQEFRLASTDNRTIEYLVGAYYLTEDYKTRLQATLDLSLSALAGIFYSDRLGRNQQFSQDTDSWAVFGELVWNVSDTFRAKFGGRYTDDEKTANKRLWYSDASTLDNAVPDPDIAASYNGVIGVEHNLVGVKRSTDDFSPAVTLEWDANDDIMTYLSYTEGFKAGGFDEDFTSGVIEDFEFEDENVESWALGAKITMADGRGYLNAEYFNGEFKNLQVSTFSVASFLVGNAAAATSQGLDMDGRWQFTDRFGLGAAVVFLDAEYDDYDTAPCPLDDAGNPTAEFCDLTGEPLQYAPDFSGSVFADYTMPVGSWEMGFYADLNYTDDFFLAGDNDPDVVQDSYTKINARVSFTSGDGRYILSVVGKNLTDEITSHQGNDIPLAGLYGGKGLSSFLDPPRTVALQAEMRF